MLCDDDELLCAADNSSIYNRENALSLRSRSNQSNVTSKKNAIQDN